MKKFIALIMTMALALSLCACGGGGDTAAEDPNLGMYNCTATSISGIDMGVDGEWIELKANDKTTVYLMGVELDGTYVLDGEAITFDLDGETASGTLVDGIMTIDFWGMECVYEKEGGAPPAASSEKGSDSEDNGSETEAEPETAASGYDWWEGDWYGWWVAYSAHGQYESLEDDFWDVCAKIDVNGDKGTIVLWDEDCSASDPLMKADVSFRTGLTDYGTMTCESGYFDTVTLNHADWSCDPGSSTVTEFNNMIELTFKVSYTEDDWIDLYIFLRPWTVYWDDIANGDTSECIYDSMMPGLYYDWYVPLIDSNSKMPESFK